MNIYIEKYLNELEFTRKLSKNTILSYKDNLTNFYNYFKNKDILTLKKSDIIKYLESLDNLKDTSLAHYFTVINNFYNFCLENDYLNNNPCEDIHLPKLRKKLPVYLTYEEIDKLLDMKLETPYDYRTKAMLELLYASGIRISELISLRFSNIDFENSIIRVEGKGNKERLVPYNDTSSKYLNLYINTYRSPRLRRLCMFRFQVHRRLYRKCACKRRPGSSPAHTADPRKTDKKRLCNKAFHIRSSASTKGLSPCSKLRHSNPCRRPKHSN